MQGRFKIARNFRLKQQYWIYIHALVRDPDNLDAAIRSAKIHVMLPDRVFQVALAHIDLAASPLSRRQRFNHIHDSE